VTATAWLVAIDRPVAYDPANEAMHRLAERRLSGDVPDAVVLLEHPPVFTAGRRARDAELLWDREVIEARGGSVRRIDRGGSFTFHGPGQLVGYPIVDLGSRPDAGRYLRTLEDAVIETCADLGAAVTRRADIQTGVWAGDRKVCAIGVRLLRARVTLHGFALNCDPDLSWFDGIIACGLPDHGVTSLSELLERDVSVEEVRPIVQTRLAQALDLRLEPAPPLVSAAFAATADVA
jgi:lipoyl(octanoyl) transferase